jgi:potassium channel subfamily K, other eukaryote
MMINGSTCSIRLSGLRLICVSAIGGEMAYISLICLLVLVSTSLPLQKEHPYTRAFYFAIISAALYFVISGLMIYAGVFVLNWKVSQPIRANHKLMRLTVLFMACILVGAAAFW